VHRAALEVQNGSNDRDFVVNPWSTGRQAIITIFVVVIVII
jgi:hypothetical protein